LNPPGPPPPAPVLTKKRSSDDRARELLNQLTDDKQRASLLRRKSLEPSEKTVLCVVCYENYKPDDFFSLPKCKEHLFCVNCTNEHIEAAINDKQREIPCMHDGCTNKFTIKALEKLKVAETMILKFKQTDEEYKVAVSNN